MVQMPSIFIDGEYGTTGLEIRQRLESLPVIVYSIPNEQRHDYDMRQQMMSQVDLVILCLPDVASREAVSIINNFNGRKPRILDASTAFRTDSEWVYGFPEWESGQKEAIAEAHYVSNPGCYASGAIALLHPIIKAGLISADLPLTINAISGYTGGGRKMIEAYEKEKSAPAFELYSLDMQHKHIPEICKYSGLTKTPLFIPSVANFPRGMIVSIPIHTDWFSSAINVDDITECLRSHYGNGKYVRLITDSETRLSAEALAHTDRMELRVHQNKLGNQILLTASLDNLGKGASGAAIQNIQLMLDL